MKKRNFSKIYLLFISLLAVLSLQAQTYNNEWIDNAKTYYKFKIVKDGLYRINGTTLSALGLGAVPATQFQLWRNGVQVPLYISSGGTLGGSDYIAFWGEHNDGSVDAQLFRHPIDQLNKANCFETDSATYFLTTNATIVQNLRFQSAINDVNNKPAGLSAEPYFLYTVQKDLGTSFNRGAATAYGSDYVYSSDYKAKTFGKVIKPGNGTSVSFANLYAYASGSLYDTLAVGLAGSSTLGVNRTIQLTGTDGSSLLQPLGKFEARVMRTPVNVTGNFTATIKVNNSNANDRVTASFARLHYARTFDFANQSSFGFSLQASAQARYLEITNFNAAGSTPVLYDITHHKRYVAEVSGSLYKFLLPAMSNGKFALVGQATASYTSIAAAQITKRNFPDLSDASLQGDYLIISNKALYGSGNYVQQYASYRASAVGGGYKTQVYNIGDLEDMFAFGIKSSPLSVKNFMRYARAHFAVKPQFIFLIGRGLSFNNMRGANAANPAYKAQDLVPTYGWPASDVLLVADGFEPVAATPVGRLSAAKPEEVKIYLDKVKAYELSQQTDDNTVANNAWKKNVLFISGGGSVGEDNVFSGYLNLYNALLKDTFFGAKDYHLSKTTADEVSSSSAVGLKALFAKGLNLINYYGHGASTTIGYGELNDPTAFNNNGHYPIMFTSGCDVGDCYSYMPGRQNTLNNITERYLFAKDKGSVGFIAETYLGVTSYLHRYNLVLYKQLATAKYGQPITHSLIDGQKAIIGQGGHLVGDSITSYAHAEQTSFFGDPAITLYSFAKPDFAVDKEQIFAPQAVSITDNKFHVKAYLYNLGKAIGDSVQLEITRKRADGSIEVLLSKNILSIRNRDSIEIDIPINPNTDVGNNDITLSLDGNEQYDELSELNNAVTKTVFVYANGITPVYPYNYSIINRQTTPLVASTSDALAPKENYVLELDTSSLFHSAFKITKTISSIGGAIEFAPGISYTDSTVYYWRVSPVPTPGGTYRWASSSFQYIAGNTEGSGQSHLYQHLASTLERIRLDSTSREWVFADRNNEIQINHAVVASGVATGYSNFSILLNGKGGFSSYYCKTTGNSLLFNVFTPNGLKPYFNQSAPATLQSGPNSSIGGFMGAVAACGSTPYSYDVNPSNYPNANKFNFQFSYQTASDRNKIARFMDWIPNGSYVIVRLIVTEPFANVPMVDIWKTDNGGGLKSLYQEFLDAGMSEIDNFDIPKAGVFIYKKADKQFPPIQTLTEGIGGQIHLIEQFKSKDTLGYITSPIFGPAKEWKTVQWNGESLDSSSTDNATVEVIGIQDNGQQTLLNTLTTAQQNFDISNIDAATYPYIQLKMRNADSIHYTPYQLRYWHLLYTPLPEGALAGNIMLDNKDTLELGQSLHFAIAFKNVSNQVFADSILAQLTLHDKDNHSFQIPIRSLKKLQPGDTALINITIPGDTSTYNNTHTAWEQMPVGTINLTGSNILSLDINPGDNQPEESHNNNFLFKKFYVRGDVHNPLLDVTFDGVHILDNDIVAAKPKVTIRLNDDSKYLLLNDTSVAQVSLKYPDGSIRRFGYNSDTLSFVPARDSSNNEAVIDFRPYLTQDGTYELIVKGQGKAGAATTATDYSVSFQVYNKPMISDMFNYPNPFTSSTAFVFTITGSQVPQNIRIQIMTITGKIVKEITKAELGSLHIGRNITEYKWDGTDNFGQKLANGVYLYRVITNQDGKSLDRFKIKDANGNEVNTGKYFNKGYGKMYLMR